MSWTATLAHGLAEYLAAAGVAVYRPTGVYRDDETGIVIGAVPASPLRVVVLTPYQLSDNVDQADSVLGLQVRVRSARPDPREVPTWSTRRSTPCTARHTSTSPAPWSISSSAPHRSRWARTRTTATSSAFSAATRTGSNNAMLWDSSGWIVELSPLAPGPTWLAWHNAADTYVGETIGPDGKRHAVRWDIRGQVTDLGMLPGATGSTATATNDAGIIVGVSGQHQPQRPAVLVPGGSW